MTDLEITKKCAEKMGINGLAYGGFNNPSDMPWFDDGKRGYRYYDPLTNDAQAMALVKKLNLCIDRNSQNAEWIVYGQGLQHKNRIHSSDINRAIVECVAKLPD